MIHDHDDESKNSSSNVQTYTIGSGKSQIHIFGGKADEQLNLAFHKIEGFSHGHHVRSGGGNDDYNFKNTSEVRDTIVGRIEDFDYSRDTISIEGSTINLLDLPDNVDILSYNGQHNDRSSDTQQWLSIKLETGNILYALEGARVDMNGNGGSNNGLHEAHFITKAPEVWELEKVGFIDPQNVIPAHWSTTNGLYINDTDVAPPDVRQVISGSGDNDLIAGGLNDDTVKAGGGNDRVWGGSGDDKLFGKQGRDVLIGNTGDDKIFGGVGSDLLIGGYGDDIANGGRGADRIVGGAGNDKIFGMLGADRLIGGAGNDEFIYLRSSDSKANGSQQDIIVDFQRGRDQIDLSSIDANLYRGGDQSFDFQGRGGFDGLDGRGDVRIQQGNSGLMVSVDINADGAGDMWVFLRNVTSLTSDDFIL